MKTTNSWMELKKNNSRHENRIENTEIELKKKQNKLKIETKIH